MCIEFKILKDKTLSSVVNNDNEEIIFKTSTGESYKLYHDQDCCEGVQVEEIHGSLDDLINTPILLAEEVCHKQNETPDECSQPREYDDSWTWTFYKLSTIKGSVTIRWCGTSNGYYSESVDFCQLGTAINEQGA